MTTAGTALSPAVNGTPPGQGAALAPHAANDPYLVLEQVLQGNVAGMNGRQRLAYYATVCESLGLNPATTPFVFIKTEGGVALYPTKGATDQLARKYGVRLVKLPLDDSDRVEGLYLVRVRAEAADGRTVENVGAVSIEGLRGNALANAVMKAHTKGYRRAVLSLIGLGLADESEMEGVRGAAKLVIDPATGEFVGEHPISDQEPQTQPRQLSAARSPSNQAAKSSAVTSPTPKGAPAPADQYAKYERNVAAYRERGVSEPLLPATATLTELKAHQDRLQAKWVAAGKPEPATGPGTPAADAEWSQAGAEAEDLSGGPVLWRDEEDGETVAEGRTA